MSEFFVLLAVAVFSAPVLALIAIVRASKTRKELQALEIQVRTLEAQLGDLRRERRAGTEEGQSQATRTREEVRTLIEPLIRPSGQYTPSQTGPVLPPPLPAAPAPAFQPFAEPTPAETPVAATEPITLPSRPAILPVRVVDWEKFLGVKLFAWVGGLALFLGIAFFVKYSFDRNLISPEMRIALGYLAALGLVIGGVVLRRKEYAVTAQTLSATGIVALYAVSFAAHALYRLIGTVPVFAVMTLVTATAFVLAVRMNAQLVAILGILGGFLTPPLLATGQDNPVGLFGYALLLNAGLIGVALFRRWHFLILLGAICTGITEVGWLGKFFEPQKINTAMAVLSLFNAVFLAGFVLSNRKKSEVKQTPTAVFLQAMLTLGITMYFLGRPELAGRPWTILSLTFVADVAVLAMLFWRHETFKLQLISGTAVFVILAQWIQGPLLQKHLYWALGATLFFAALHSIFPLVLQRRRKLEVPVVWANIFPLIALALVLLVLTRMEAVTVAVWPAILLLDLLVIGLTLFTATAGLTLGAILLTAIITAAWILRIPTDWSGTGTVLIIGVFTMLFVGAGLWLLQKFVDEKESEEEGGVRGLPQFLPAISAVLPFLLLAMMVMRLNTVNPSNIFGLAFVMDLVLLWLARRTKTPELGVAALGATLFLEFYWHRTDFSPDHAGIGLAWYLIFYALFAISAFVRREQVRSVPFAWAVSALSGPLHFYMIYHASKALLGNFPAMGLIPALMAIPALGALAAVVKRFELNEEERFRLLAWFGGSALFFITMIFPVQFDRQWLTIGWALEGVALLWLFQRVPHRGLPVVGVALLLVAFVRLGLNPKILSYYQRSETPIFNWYLYSYGIVTVCLFFGARLLAPPRNMVLNRNTPPLLFTLGTILAFILLNIEIADFFGTSNYLQFEFSGNFARNMTYSIAWALFGLVLLIVGIGKQIAAVRYASMALLGVTLLKLFLHDLRTLDAGYRIGAFIGVAIVLITASWAYQRYLASAVSERKTTP
jgi:uncharacterized membrane protein